ncbi:MAG: FAD-dependent thymidylate synthase [Chloroflexota bacterium]|nr:FAD-dependent thymidylate synthase [Chloroflexota bacterium]MDE2959194.1 FAD-dependent thymidylate synthase [Chloroflexota bacterium]
MRQPLPAPAHRRRIYPLSPRKLTEEQIAVTFAMTSRRPEPFDEIATQVSAERAADFNERWVVGYGHASVAEHAIVHLAVENISRLACDALEDNRLASYTEKSSRYQVIDPESFHVPSELDAKPALRAEYVSTCRALFTTYSQLIDGVTSHLRSLQSQRDGESNSAYRLRLRRQATDACRAILPASTLTNVGLTANARTLEHAISKLMSSDLAEERNVGSELREQGRSITPTLVKYADHSPYLAGLRRIPVAEDESATSAAPVTVRLLDYDRDATCKLAAALQFRRGGDYGHALSLSEAMTETERIKLIDRTVRDIGPHDAPPREFELAGYTFEFVFDYGAMREFRRHRMQTYLGQPLTVVNGYDTPPLVDESGLTEMFDQAVSQSEQLYSALAGESPALAQYAVTHAHRQRVLSRMNLRECYHLFKLRSSAQAHRSIREPVLEAMRLAVEAQPELFRHLPLRNAPAWWPFGRG